MRSHRGAGRDRRDSLAGWWPAAECIAAPVPVDRHRNVSMAFTLVALTLLFLALAMFGPAQPGSAEQAAAGAEAVADPAALTVVVEPVVAPEATSWATVTMSGTQ
jgi:hypothetical protein